MVALPRALGEWLLGPIWRPTFPLVMASAVAIAAGGMVVGASAGLRALGSSRRSLRAQAVTSILYLVLGLAGANPPRGHRGGGGHRGGDVGGGDRFTGGSFAWRSGNPTRIPRVNGSAAHPVGTASKDG